MSKGPVKNTAVIQRLLTERRQFEAWIARLDAAAGATPQAVRTKVRADYEARLQAVIAELRNHAEAARQVMGEQHELQKQLEHKESRAAEKLVETELRHAVGELDEAEWTRVHKDALAELVTIRQELKAVEADIAQLEELDALVRRASPTPPRAGAPARSADGAPTAATTAQDELSFLKSVSEEGQDRPQSTIRRSTGAQFQPATPAASAPRRTGPAQATPMPPNVVPEAGDFDETAEPARTLQCKECGSMNLPTEWYCEQCGSELAAL
ncbi:MAG: hypothetical protein ACREMR_04770 [Gemmatimonadales bacterium]